MPQIQGDKVGTLSLTRPVYSQIQGDKEGRYTKSDSPCIFSLRDAILKIEKYYTEQFILRC